MSNLSPIVKSIQDIMRQDAGINGDAQRIEQMVWLLFLKVFDALEEEDSLKRADILGAYSFEEAFPVMFYGGMAYTPKEFVLETGIAPPAI